MNLGSNWKKYSQNRSSLGSETALEFYPVMLPYPTPPPCPANFEFIAEDGSINECDLLVFSSEGFFLIEIKESTRKAYGGCG